MAARPPVAAEAAATGTDARLLGGAAALLAFAALCVAGCGGTGGAAGPSRTSQLSSYLDRVEPLRLAVNDLLDRADPILGAYAEHRIGPAAATRRFGALERRFAGYATRVAAIEPVPAEIRAAHLAYAHTYVLEDSYLSALTAALERREFDALPDTQNDQRATIIAWRIRLEVLARRLGLKLPADLQQAGRGEIAPSPEGD